MELDLLDTIVSGTRIVASSKGPLVFIHPFMRDRQISKYYYDEFIKKNKSTLQSADDMLKEHKRYGMWSDAKEKQLVELPKMIDAATEELKSVKLKSKIKQLEKWLNTLQRLYLECLTAKNNITSNSLEVLANYHAIGYLLFRCFRSLDNNLLWKSYEELLSSNDVDYINELNSLYLELTVLAQEKQIREIARSSFWRIKWASCKQSFSELFNRSAMDMTNDQFMLVYWSQIYDMVYESMDRPPDDVVQDDEKLDNWLDEEAKKRKADIKQRFYSSGTTNKKKNKLSNANEVFIMVDGEFSKNGQYRSFSEDERLEKIKQVNESNRPNIRAIKQKEEKTLEGIGHLVHEGDLRKGLTNKVLGATNG